MVRFFLPSKVCVSVGCVAVEASVEASVGCTLLLSVLFYSPFFGCSFFLAIDMVNSIHNRHIVRTLTCCWPNFHTNNQEQATHFRPLSDQKFVFALEVLSVLFSKGIHTHAFMVMVINRILLLHLDRYQPKTAGAP